MIRLKLLGTAVFFSLLAASPALGQHMLDEPGMYAFTYPMGDLGLASSRPSADARAMMHSGRPMKSRIATSRSARHGK
ncbi:MAG: hypothetical protein ACRC1G_00735 [Bradyrhizobium sp.]|nr:hypothetical protein [Bradyrhizobium sp.]